MQAVRWGIVQAYLTTLQDNILLVLCEMREMSFFREIKLGIFSFRKRHLAHLAESCLHAANLFFLGKNVLWAYFGPIPAV